MLICALTVVAPYYDCPEYIDGVDDGSGQMWLIEINDDYEVWCGDSWAWGCAIWRGFDIPIIRLSTNHMYFQDESPLWHEIQHIRLDYTHLESELEDFNRNWLSQRH